MSKEADDSINEAINELYSEVDDSILQESKENLNNKPTKLI